MITLSSRRRVPVEIGIAPLVDCVFLLLIFFLLSSSFDRERRLPLELPNSSTACDDTSSNTFVLEILPDSRLRMAGRIFSLDALEEELRRKPSLSGIRIRAARNLPLQDLTQVLDGIRRSGIHQVDLSCYGADNSPRGTP